MNIKLSRRLFLILPLLVWLAACVGTQTFTTAARPGDTIALAVGWQKSLARQNVTVTITDAAGAVVIYPPNDSRVRGIVNMYPDPVSRAVVGINTNQDLGYHAQFVASGIGTQTGLPNGETDFDWWQTVVLLDLPSSLATGTATISFADSAGASIYPANVNVLPGTGSANGFNVYSLMGGKSDLSLIYPTAIQAMERADYSTITFSGSIIPHAIQVAFSHTPGVGKAWVVNPRGDIKTLVWTDDGTNTTVILTPVDGQNFGQWIDCKFYISGGITGLTQTNLKAYDVNGLPMSGVTASIQ